MDPRLAQLLAENPWYQSGAAVAQAPIPTEGVKPWETMAMHLARGLGSGVMTGYGRAQGEAQQAGDNKLLTEALAQPDFQSRYDKLAENPRYASLAESLLETRMKDEISNPHRYAAQSTYGAPAKVGKVFPGDRPSMQQKYNELLQAGIGQGMTPNAAADYASTLTAAERKAATGSVDKVAEVREKAKFLKNIADTAEAGASGAGNTGTFMQPLRKKKDELFSLFGDTEAEDRLASLALLDSTKPDIVRAVRTAGVGAMSDREMQQYLQAGPSSLNTPEANAVLIEKIKTVAEIQQDYADFLDTYREENGTVNGAEQLWRQYTADYPMFVKQGNELVVNQQRPSWYDYFTGQGEAPTAPASTPQAPQEQGQAYSVDQLLSAGYSQADIEALKQQGLVR